MNNISFYLLSFFAVACYASLSPIAKKVGIEIPTFAFISITMAMLCIFAALASYFFENEFSLKMLTVKTYSHLAIFAVINFIGFSAYIYVIKHIPIMQYQLINASNPIVSGMIAYFLLGEPIHWRYLVGLIFVAIGLGIALYQPVKVVT